MAVHIRLSRAGTKKRPIYRLVVTDHRSPRGGKFLENIGTFDPSPAASRGKKDAKKVDGFKVDAGRLAFWTRSWRNPVSNRRSADQRLSERRIRTRSLRRALPANSPKKKAAAPESREKSSTRSKTRSERSN